MNSQGNLVQHSSLENHIAIKRFKSPHQYFLLLNRHCRVKYEIYNQTVASKKKDTEVTVIQKKGKKQKTKKKKKEKKKKKKKKKKKEKEREKNQQKKK